MGLFLCDLKISACSAHNADFVAALAGRRGARRPEAGDFGFGDSEWAPGLNVYYG
jgi:hypothetical protein